MPLPLGPFLVAGATAAIGYFFQSHRAKIVKERDLREAELSQAQEICKEIMKSMDVLYYQLRRGAMPVAIRKAQDDPSREEQDLATWGGV